MEGLIKRIGIIVAIFAGFGLWNLASARTVYAKKTETWMEDNSPMDFDGYRMIPSNTNPKQSYRMDDASYNLLRPYGIVSRVYQKGDEAYDVVLIASQNRESFHDPRVCFSGQGWTLSDQHESTIDTSSRGKVPVTITKISSQSERQIAAFFYRSPIGFHATTIQHKLGMFAERLRGGTNVDGVFYRIIPRHAGATEEQLLSFAAKYLDAANSFSKGYF